MNHFFEDDYFLVKKRKSASDCFFSWSLVFARFCLFFPLAFSFFRCTFVCLLIKQRSVWNETNFIYDYFFSFVYCRKRNMSDRDYLPLSATLVKTLTDKLYEKRKTAALEIEKWSDDWLRHSCEWFFFGLEWYESWSLRKISSKSNGFVRS